MNLTKKIFITFIFLFFFFLGCKQEVEIPNNDDDIELPPVVEEPSDNVKFVNQTDLIVRVFTDPLEGNLVSELKEKAIFSCKVDVIETGNVFYYKYYLELENIIIPYGSGENVVDLQQDKLITINIPEPKELTTNKNIVIMENVSESAIAFGFGASELLPENKTSTLINSGEYGIYLLKDNNDLGNYKVFDTGKEIALSEYKTNDKGYIYSFRYTGKDISLYSKTSLDISLREKIWKLSLSQDVGKTLLAGHFTSRKNPSDGYMLFGRQVYSNDEDLIDNSIPYYVFLDSNGDILDEQTISFKDNPLDVKVRRVIDSGDYILACGEKLSSENISSAFIIGIEGLSVYADILVGDKNVVASAQTMVQKEDDCFCVLTYKDKYSENDEYLSSSVALVEFTVDSYSSVSSKILWESSDEKDLWAYDLTYDESSDTYAVLTWNDEKQYTKLFFIDGSSGTEKFDNILLNTYAFSKISKSIDGKVILCGSFINQLTDSREACFIEIDVSTGTSVNNFPKTFPCKDKKLSSYFNDVIFKNDYIVLVGCTDYLYSGEFDDTIPYLVAYDISKDKVIWEQRFDNLKGYEVYSCNNTNLSFIYELYNSNTMHSYIVSAGLLGEIPEETKLTLPYSSTISEVETPDVSVYFYENATSEEDSHYKEAIFKYGDEITLDDLEKYPPTSFSDGYEILGWYEWGCEAEEEIVFPYKLNSTSLTLYPKICLSAPKNLSGFALSNSEIYLEWNANPAATNYDIYINDTLFATTSSTKYTVIGLNPKTTYKVYVVASNGNDRSKSSDLIQVTTTTYYRGDINQVPSSAFRMRNNIWYYNTLQDVDVHYYFMFLDAGNTYEIVWCDSNDGSEVLAEEGLYPYADVVVNMYLAGETNSSKFNCFEINSGYTDPYQITPSESGYYVVEVVGNSKSRGYYLVGYVQIDSINQYGLLLSGDIAGDISDAGLPLVYEGEGIYTLTFTYENNMKQWGSPLGTCQFKIRTVAGSWEDVSYGLSSKHPVINGGEVPCIEVPDSNFIVDGFIVGTTYKITVRCTSTGEVFVKINTV
ncbi:MAG: fibronectin type III domain-containing protein [Spirochaetaceae bacterium]|nr:fibronectin type III domain-containing protein [Spirochaetaceae bacterium]